MNPSFLVLVLASAVSAPAPGEEPIKPPQGLPPSQVIASMTKAGEFEITESVMVPEQRSEERVVIVGGKPVKQVVTVTVLRTVQVTRRVKSEGVKVYTAGGKEVDSKDVSNKLKQPTIVLWAMDGKKVDPFYLKIIKPDTLVFVASLPAGGNTPIPQPLPEKPAKPEDKPRLK